MTEGELQQIFGPIDNIIPLHEGTVKYSYNYCSQVVMSVGSNSVQLSSHR